MQFQGIYTPVITPFHADGSLDEAGFAAVINAVIEAGVHGIVVGGTTGEYYAMTRDERVRSIELAKQVIAGRVSLTAGVGALRTEDAVGYATAAREIGVDAVLIGAPYYAMPTERELIHHVLSIDRAANLPVMLYNFPDRTGVHMGEQFLDRVSRSPNFCAIKESSGDINRVHLLARDYPHIQMCCGMDDQALEFFAWGAKSWVCAGSNFLPREHVALYEACVLEKDFDQGRRIMSAMLPLMRTLEQGGKFVQCIKYGCELDGLPAGPVRKPLRGLNAQLKREFAATVETLKKSVAAIRPAK